MSEVKMFKTESKRLLDLMINSIYTNKEIFLREIISNASDAIDKYHYLSLTNDALDKNEEYKIYITLDSDERTITISDNGIGMTYEELNDALGTIAKSGSKEFVEAMSGKDHNLEIIGQFGVGFYSAFMVSSKVEVKTKSPFSNLGYLFESEGCDSYAVSEIDYTGPFGNNHGTSVILHLRENTEEEKYDEYLDQFRIQDLVKKYSDYVRYPIMMLMTTSMPKKDSEGKYTTESEEVIEEETLNSMTPIWKKRKNEVSDKELNEFYKQKYYDYQDPLTNIFINIEGALNYTALIYIPKNPPYNLYSEKYEKGLQLYCKGVFIMDKCKELVPDYLRFIKGLVDSSDLSLNISREILQQNKDLKKIATNIEKRILSKLEKMLENEREMYEDFFNNFGVNLKFGIYDNFGEKKDLLKDLILYKSVNENKMITFKEYISGLKEGQKEIYYASGSSVDAVKAMPQMDLLKSRGYDVLVLTDEVDEFIMNILGSYEDYKFKSINQGDLGIEDVQKDERIKNLSEDKKDILDKIKESLGDKVEEVRFSKRLVDSAVCIVSTEGISLEMEKVLKNNPTNQNVVAGKILEINPEHNLFKAIENIYLNGEDLDLYADLLYSQALLIEGFTLDDPIAFSNRMCELIIKSSK